MYLGTDHLVICDYVHDDTLSEMGGGGMEEIPKEILNAIDSFNVESDDEFLGFEVLCLITQRNGWNKQASIESYV